MDILTVPASVARRPAFRIPLARDLGIADRHEGGRKFPISKAMTKRVAASAHKKHLLLDKRPYAGQRERHDSRR